MTETRNGLRVERDGAVMRLTLDRPAVGNAIDIPMARAFMDEVGAQCGICTPGMIMTAVSLGPRPSLARIRTGLAGNLCRCTGYEAIYRAVRKAT